MPSPTAQINAIQEDADKVKKLVSRLLREISEEGVEPTLSICLLQLIKNLEDSMCVTIDMIGKINNLLRQELEPDHPSKNNPATTPIICLLNIAIQNTAIKIGVIGELIKNKSTSIPWEKLPDLLSELKDAMNKNMKTLDEIIASIK